MLYSVLGLAAFLFALPLTSLAEPHARAHNKRHHDLAKRVPGNVDVFKRDSYSNARWTYYDVGLGACGITNVASDFIVALNSDQYGSGYPGPYCFKTITMSYNGKTTQATITDECPGCPWSGLDLSRGLFDYFASESEGVLYGTWWFDNDSGSSSTTSTSTWTPTTTSQWTPTTTWTPTTSSSEWTPTTTWTPETTTWTPTTTSTWSSSTWSSSSSSWTSSSSWSSSSWSSSSWSSSSASLSSIDYSSGAASGLAIPTGSTTDGVISDMNEVVINLGAVIVAGYEAI